MAGPAVLIARPAGHSSLGFEKRIKYNFGQTTRRHNPDDHDIFTAFRDPFIIQLFLMSESGW
jgi:hypothetical protein